MKRNFLQAKVFVTALVIGFGMLASLLPTMPVHAAGETYTYKDSSNITLRGSTIQGGSINLKRSGLDVQSNVFQGGGNLTGGCGFTLSLTVSGDGKTGTTTAVGVPQQTANGTIAGCTANQLTELNGKNVTVQGTAGDTETADEKSVNVTVFLATEAPSKPATIKITIKDAAGKVLSSADAKKETLPDGVGYTAIFSVGPDADYQACAAAPVDKCQNFHKDRHQKKLITFGETSGTRNINVEIKITGVRAAGEAFTLGPADVTWELTNGGNAQTVQTDKKDIAAVAAGEGALGDFSSTLNAVIKDVDVGKYKICVPAINQCKEVDKKEFADASVTFDGTNKLDAFQGTEDGAKPSPIIGTCRRRLRAVSAWRRDDCRAPFETAALRPPQDKVLS